jgi:AraC-like DNA-binding protein
MQFAISSIIQSKGGVPLQDLQKYLQISERSFERKFKQYVGITPKLFSRISRFQASLHELRIGLHNKLTDVAYENDYADQSHFIRSFKEFAGCSPLQYQKQLMQSVDNFYERTK